MKRWWNRYESGIKRKYAFEANELESSLKFWQNQLFINFLVFCLPVSVIAVVPGIFMALKDGYPLIAAVDLICVTLITIVTFSSSISIRKKKISIIVIFYCLALFLTSTLGYIGPGIFYLFALTVLIALILSVNYAWYSILFNTLSLLTFALIIQFRLFDSALIHEYSTGKWLAFSSNLIFLSIVLVVLIDRIFKGLQSTIMVKNQLQERYKSIFDRSPLPMWLFDVDTFEFVDVNEAAIRQYGYTRSEFLLMTIKDIRPKDKIAALENLVKTNRVTGKYHEGIAEHIKKNGEHIMVMIESNLINLDGRRVRIVLATDITEKLKNELEILDANAQIKQAASNLNAIFNSSIEAFILLDREGIIKAFNSKALEYIKINARQNALVVGESIYSFTESHQRENFKTLVNRVLDGEVVEYDRRYRRIDKQICWVHHTLTPVYEEGLICGFCITGRDITVTKIYVRTIEEQNKAFREISWMQSHGVRAPLARIMGLVALLEKEPAEQERTLLLEYLKISSTELDEVIRDITVRSSKAVLAD